MRRAVATCRHDAKMAALRYALIGTAALLSALAGAEPVIDGPWQIGEGVYRIAAPGQNHVYLADEPYIFEEGVIEATIVVKQRAAAGGWATAGLVLMPTLTSYWNLGLVEGPDGAHYTELVEDYQGVHQAQSYGATQLAPIEGARGAAWEYEVTYRLRLVLTRRSVVGEVYRQGDTQPLARHGYLLSGEPAVREGWAALRCENFDAEIRDVRVTAAPRRAQAPARDYPSARRGCVGIYLGTDMPGAQRPPDLSRFRQRLSEAGFAVAELTTADVLTPGTFVYPGLDFLCADLRRLPAVAVQPLVNWMRDGGILVSLTAPAFSEFYWRSGDRWLDWDAYVREGLTREAVQPQPVVTWNVKETARWREGHEGAREAAVAVAPGAGPNGEDCLKLSVPHFRAGWWTLARTFEAPPIARQDLLTCFWARGDD
ncbi:MAG: hypothetical protein N2512_04610, partial [Armatimonadetes bacterium]|nr:hypothetical protein [Armatimonadota bacterium]